MQILSENQFQYTFNHNKFDTFILRMLILFICQENVRI